jgi:hypothetical protein
MRQSIGTSTGIGIEEKAGIFDEFEVAVYNLLGSTDLEREELYLAAHAASPSTI